MATSLPPPEEALDLLDRAMAVVMQCVVAEPVPTREEVQLYRLLHLRLLQAHLAVRALCE